MNWLVCGSESRDNAGKEILGDLQYRIKEATYETHEEKSYFMA